MKDRVRILRVIGRLNIGGPAINAVLLTERLDSSRYSSMLIAGTEDSAEGNYLRLRGRSLSSLKVISTPGGRVKWEKEARAFGTLLSMVKSFRPHIVHTHTAKAGLLGRLAARWAGVPIVVHTYHGHVLDGYFSPLKTRGLLACERGLAGLTDRILSVSETVRGELLAKGIGRPDQHTVVPLGLDLEPYLEAGSRRGVLRQELGLGAEDLTVGIVARLVPIKRHEVFLRAARIIATEVPSCCFVVVGDGERRLELENLARALGLDERVRFLGWRADLPAVYADLDVVVLCSRNEGSPVALIEAMAAGRAVVATRVGGVPDLVEDGVNGLLVPPDDAHSLAEAVVALGANPEHREAFGAAARKRVFPAFSSERLVRDIDELYRELLERKGIGPVVAGKQVEDAAQSDLLTDTMVGQLKWPAWAAKRVFDVALATIGLMLSVPVWLVVALAIKIEDGGPVFFLQERWGQGRQRIRVYKFRTMVHDSNPAALTLQATENDPRVTRVGRFLRATALDELPQLLNIWKGEMSFVGPRALPINELQVRENGRHLPDEEIPGFRARLQVKPGLTGIAQVYAPRDVPRRHKFKYDLLYVRNQSFWLDLRLISVSVWITLSGRWEERRSKV